MSFLELADEVFGDAAASMGWLGCWGWMGKWWRKPRRDFALFDDSDALWCRSPPCRRHYGVFPLLLPHRTPGENLALDFQTSGDGVSYRVLHGAAALESLPGALVVVFLLLLGSRSSTSASMV